MDIQFEWRTTEEERKSILSQLNYMYTIGRYNSKAPTSNNFIFKSPTLSDAKQESGTKWCLELTTGNNYYIQLKLYLADVEMFNNLNVTYKITLESELCEYASIKGKNVFDTRQNCKTCSEKFCNAFFMMQMVKDLGSLIFQCNMQIQERTTINIFDQIQNDYEKIFNNEKYSDFKLLTTGKEFNVHKNILAARSDVFAAMFELDMKEKKEGSTEIKEFDHETFQELLRYIYCGKIENLEKLAKDLLTAADKYLIYDLKVLCLEQLCKNISIENAVELLLLVESHGIDHLKVEITNYIVQNIKDIIDKSNLESIGSIKLLNEILRKTVNDYI